MEPVTYAILVEKVYAGFVPATSAPLLAFLAVVLAVSIGCGLPRRLAERIQRELADVDSEKTK